MSSTGLIERVVGIIALCAAISFGLAVRAANVDDDCARAQIAEFKAAVLASHFIAQTRKEFVDDLESDGAIECDQPTTNTIVYTAFTYCDEDDTPGSRLELHAGQTPDGTWTFIP